MPSIKEATAQLERALQEAGARRRTWSTGFLTKPHEAIEKLGPIDDPMIGVFVHWTYAPAHRRRRGRQGQPAAAGLQLLGHAGRAWSPC